MTLRERLEEEGYEDVVLFENYDYEPAFIGVSFDGRAVYDYDLMVKYLVDKEGWEVIQAIEWIEYNTLRALPYIPNAPIVIERFDNE